MAGRGCRDRVTFYSITQTCKAYFTIWKTLNIWLTILDLGFYITFEKKKKYFQLHVSVTFQLISLNGERQIIKKHYIHLSLTCMANINLTYLAASHTAKRGLTSVNSSFDFIAGSEMLPKQYQCWKHVTLLG